MKRHPNTIVATALVLLILATRAGWLPHSGLASATMGALAGWLGGVVVLPRIDEWFDRLQMRLRWWRTRRNGRKGRGHGSPDMPMHINCRCTIVPRNPSPHAQPGETEADTIGRLLANARVAHPARADDAEAIERLSDEVRKL